MRKPRAGSRFRVLRKIPFLGPRLADLKHLLRRLAGKPRASHAIARHPFDARYGVHTSGLLEAQELRTGHSNDAFTTAYFGVPPSRFQAAIDRWRATPGAEPTQSVRFVDIGCGMGRALLLACRMPFREAVGIELHPRLAAIARKNLDTWRSRGLSSAPATVLCSDVVAAIPAQLEGPTLLYLYNPFQPPVLRALLTDVVEQHHAGAPLDVLYLFPEHESVFAEFPQFRRLWHEQIPLAPDEADDGFSTPTDPCSLFRLIPAESCQ